MLNIGIIGSGFGVIGLLPAFSSIKGCRVVAVCAQPSRAREFNCERAGVKNIYTDWRLMLENTELDAVAIAVIPSAQFQIAKVAIEKGLHVFAEKPFAANTAEAKELFELAKKKKITHGIDFMFPEIAEWKKVKTLLENESLGKLTHLSVNWDWLSGNIKNHVVSWKTKQKNGGGALSFYFSHGLYYLEHFAGRIIEAKSIFQYTPLTNDGEAGFDIALKFRGGIAGNVHVSSNSTGFVRHQLIFQCTNGVIVLENHDAIVDRFTVTTYNAKGSRQLKVKSDIGKVGEDERVKSVRKLAHRFVHSIESATPMIPSFQHALRVEELIDVIRRESKTRGAMPKT